MFVCAQQVPEHTRSPRAWQGLAGLGRAWQGLAWPGLAWPGLAGLGRAWLDLVRLGLAWPGLARLGLTWFDLVRLGSTWPDLVRLGPTWLDLAMALAPSLLVDDVPLLARAAATTRAPAESASGRKSFVQLSQLRAALLRVVLPEEVVPLDYAEFQLWDTLQALSSYARGVLTTEAGQWWWM